jgi:tetratricopeptide (TPR) repeat protein
MKKLPYISKNTIILLQFVVLSFACFYIYSLQPYAMLLQQKEESINKTIKELEEAHFVNLDWFFLSGQSQRYLARGDAKMALHWAEILVNNYGEGGISYEIRANCHYDLGNYQQALEDYCLSLSHVPIHEVLSNSDLIHRLLTLVQKISSDPTLIQKYPVLAEVVQSVSSDAKTPDSDSNFEAKSNNDDIGAKELN